MAMLNSQRVYVYAHPPTRAYLLSISLTVSLQGQPSAICYLPKKHKNKQKTRKTKAKLNE